MEEFIVNNKGVTLIELLIVIVVIGIISAFAVPAVSSFLDNAKKQAVYQDAVAVRNAAAYFCAEPTETCADGEELVYTDLSEYRDGFDAAAYDTGATDVLATYTLASNSWAITLESATDDGSFEWNDSQADPVVATADDVNVDAD